MSNVHGFNNLNQPQNQNRRNQNNQFYNPMMNQGNINQQSQQSIMNEQIQNNRVPFLNSIQGIKPPIQQSIPYTLKLVWCPTLNLLSVTLFFMIVIWIMYIICLAYHGVDNTQKSGVLAPKQFTLTKFGAVVPDLIQKGQVWRLITGAFLHADLLHIVMNSLSILFFMSRLQKCYSFLLMVIHSFNSAICGNLASTVFYLKVRGHFSVGASTVIFGVFGGLLSYMTINWKTLGAIRGQICCILGLILFIGILSSISPNVDIAGHLGGLVGGYICGIGLFPGIKPKPKIFMLVSIACQVIFYLVILLIIFIDK